MYRIAIVEDQPEESRKLIEHLERYCREHDALLQFRTFSDGLTFLECYEPGYDVILMDIEMPHMNGIDVARRLREIDENVCLIFVTIMAKYAIEGYEVRALDFILKPVEYQDVSLKLQRALDMRDKFARKELTVVTPVGMQRFEIDELYYIEVVNHTLYFHTKKGIYMERSTIKQREEKLVQHGFSRCSNSFLVNLRYVRSVVNDRITVNDRSISIGRTKRKKFLQDLTDFLGDYSI